MKDFRKWLNPGYKDRSANIVVDYEINQQNILTNIDVKLSDCARQVTIQFYTGMPYKIETKNGFGRMHKKELINSIEKARILRDAFDNILTDLERVEDDIKRKIAKL